MMLHDIAEVPWTASCVACSANRISDFSPGTIFSERGDWRRGLPRCPRCRSATAFLGRRIACSKFATCVGARASPLGLPYNSECDCTVHCAICSPAVTSLHSSPCQVSLAHEIATSPRGCARAAFSQAIIHPAPARFLTAIARISCGGCPFVHLSTWASRQGNIAARIVRGAVMTALPRPAIKPITRVAPRRNGKHK